MIKDNLDLHWDWEILSSNCAISMDEIRNNPDLPWDFNSVLIKPNIDFNYILDNLNKFNREVFAINFY